MTAPLGPAGQPSKLFGLDHLRALAIIMVMLFHYNLGYFGHPAWLAPIAKFGWTGVDLFFVLSGFLIASQLFSELKKQGIISFRTFFIKRIFRILPIYYVTVGLYFCLPFFREREALPPLWKFLTFTQNFGLDVSKAGTFSHAWSLCVEEHFYLLLPVFVAICAATQYARKWYWLLLALFIGGFFIRHYGYTHFVLPNLEEDNASLLWMEHIYYPTYNRLDGLLVGVSIAGIYRFRPTIWGKLSRFGNWFLLLGLAVLAAAYFVCYKEQSYTATVYGFPLVSVGYGCLVVAAISPTCFLYRWHSKLTTSIAAFSYAIYLTHKGVIHITQSLASKLHIAPNSFAMMLICFSMCVIIAWILHGIIEKPFMRLREKFIRK